MRGYLKAAVFIAVLLFSVSLISSAIDILGNISDIDLDEEKPAGIADAEQSAAEPVKVEATPKGTVHPLFKIHMPPRTKYLRRSVRETYEDGVWWLPEDHRVVTYQGEELELNVSGYHTIEPVTFLIEPLVNMSGFVPATLSVYQIVFEGTLDRYPALEAYFSPEAFVSTYWMSHALFEFSEAKLHTAQLSHPSNCLNVPEALVDGLRGLASEIVEDASTPMEKLKALEGYLKENYEYDEGYAYAPSNIDPVEWFLFEEGRGVCNHFNSAFVLLARSIGLPARIVNGYLVEADMETQTVWPKQAHVYAEAKFEDLGWITFDATPERIEERPQMASLIPTVTDIKGNDPVGIKGYQFKVFGTVITAQKVSQVDGLAVEIFLTISKNQTSDEWRHRRKCGLGEVERGFFNITCEVAVDLEVDDYMLVAHTIGNEVYKGSWSDPPIRIMAETEVAIETSSPTYAGRNVTLKGRLIDKSNGQPIANLTVFMEVENKTINLTTDSDGTVTMKHAFDTEGNKTAVLRLEESDYYLGSSVVVGIEVKPPPSLLHALTIFPYNLIVVGACATMGAAVLLMRQRQRRQPLQPVEEGAPPTEYVEDEISLSFESYKEGIVKLFNRFYASTQRRFSEVEGSLTPREFQQVLLEKIPEKGANPLDDLVTAFEIANYSEENPPKETYVQCQTAVETLRELI